MQQNIMLEMMSKKNWQTLIISPEKPSSKKGAIAYLDKDESCFLHKKDMIMGGEKMKPVPHQVQSNKEWWAQGSGKSVNSLKIVV